jgi:anti-sigma-K factor RskA
MSMPGALHIPEDEMIQYALGTLKETQLGTMTAHISMCNQCRAELGKIQVELASFATVQPMDELPAGARDRFLAKLNSIDAATEAKLAHARNRSRLYVTTKAFQNWLESPIPLKILSGALAAAVAFLAWDDLSHIHQIRQTGPEISRLQRDVAELAELKNFLHGSNAQQVTLRAKPAANKEPEGNTLYSASSGRLVFTASNLPAVPPGKAYELWILPSSGKPPIPAGTFTPDMQGNAAVVFPQIPPDVQAGGFGVTIENAEGSPVPTSPIVLSGQ